LARHSTEFNVYSVKIYPVPPQKPLSFQNPERYSPREPIKMTQKKSGHLDIPNVSSFFESYPELLAIFFAAVFFVAI
jgi:hypothetical protein